MTKQNFIALADVIRAAKPTQPMYAELAAAVHPDYFLGAYRQWQSMLNDLVSFCKAQNSAFNENRFRSYVAGECGPNGGTTPKTGGAR